MATSPPPDEERPRSETAVPSRADAPAERPSASPPDTGSHAGFLRLLEIHRRRHPAHVLGDVLGRGGMGEVLRAHDLLLGRELAVKRIRFDAAVHADTSSGPRLVRRFLEEARVTAQLGHPGVVPVHELGIDRDGELFFSMQLVEGQTLEEVFQFARTGAAGWTRVRVVEVLIRVCEAVAYAHSKHVIHRDLKPANIMVGRFGETYVMDWGLARNCAETPSPPDVAGRERVPRDHLSHEPAPPERGPDSAWRTQEGSIVGTPSYMSPEQAAGRLAELGPSTDVHAIGAILYQFLTGKRPYEDTLKRRDPYELLERVTGGPPTPVLELAPDAPPELVAICERAMARDPAERPRDLLAVAASLRATFDQPVHKARARLERSKPLLALHGLVTLLLVGAWAGLLLVFGVALVSDEDSRGSITFPVTVVEAPDALLDGGFGPFQEFQLVELRGELEGVLVGLPWYVALFLAGALGVGLLGLVTARRLIASLRSGEPFSDANVRRIRVLGVLVLLFGAGQVLFDAFGRMLSERLASPAYVFGGSFSVPWGTLIVAGIVFILAEAFRVGVALESRA